MSKCRFLRPVSTTAVDTFIMRGFKTAGRCCRRFHERARCPHGAVGNSRRHPPASTLVLDVCAFSLTVDTYQTHGRIALESGDMEEYNQCQSRLKELHLAGVPGVSMDEFTGYRLIYSLYRENHR